MSDKRFANLHYPGMKADPNEGKQQLDPRALSKLAPQIECIGEQAQLKLLSSSVFVMGGTPLGARFVKKLLAAGVGRVGMFGEQTIQQAHDLVPQSEESTSVLKALSNWCKEETPWAVFESFGQESIDRRLEDMVRGFDFLVCTGNEADAKRTLHLGWEHALPVLVSYVVGTRGYCGVLPSRSICEHCLILPAELTGEGLYFPLVDWSANALVTGVMDTLLETKAREKQKSGATMSVYDAGHSPWVVRSLPLVPRPDCPKCGKQSR